MWHKRQVVKLRGQAVLVKERAILLIGDGRHRLSVIAIVPRLDPIPIRSRPRCSLQLQGAILQAALSLASAK